MLNVFSVCFCVCVCVTFSVKIHLHSFIYLFLLLFEVSCWNCSVTSFPCRGAFFESLWCEREDDLELWRKKRPACRRRAAGALLTSGRQRCKSLIPRKKHSRRASRAACHLSSTSPCSIWSPLETQRATRPKTQSLI